MDEHYEYLTKLYLRLKGFIVSNLILHSGIDGNSKSELDIVAIRMPFHSQEYRWVNVQDYLETSNDSVEILIGDVKNHSTLNNVEFNKGLRKDRESIRQLIDWLGVYENVDEDLITKFEYYLNLHKVKDWETFASFKDNLTLGRFTFKFTFFCPSLSKWNGNGFKYVHGDEIFNFIWECLNESTKIKTCSRRYNFSGWNELEKYVRFFKGRTQNASSSEFVEYCKNLDKELAI